MICGSVRYTDSCACLCEYAHSQGEMHQSLHLCEYAHAQGQLHPCICASVPTRKINCIPASVRVCPRARSTASLHLLECAHAQDQLHPCICWSVPTRKIKCIPASMRVCPTRRASYSEQCKRKKSKKGRSIDNASKVKNLRVSQQMTI
jgi:hypothetical protein